MALKPMFNRQLLNIGFKLFKTSGAFRYVPIALAQYQMNTAKLNKVYNKDAREIDTIITEEIVDVIITSPPYFDLKDYGSPQQIGFGQDYNTYLNDLKSVFAKAYHITKSKGSLWVIIDVFRKDGEILLLPFDFANKIKEIGWILQDIIIWNKDKTLPWVHEGQMRNTFEYILVFSKQKEFNFDIDRIRDFTNLKKWWVKYPERYNPKGKTPTGIWNYDIPTQGSWGKGYIRHFCPLPEDLVEHIITLTTNPNDIVLDPFAGTGTVLIKAEQMDRNFIGIELNTDYINMFENYRNSLKNNENSISVNDGTAFFTQDKFEETIINLRILKFANTIIKEVVKAFELKSLFVLAEKTTKSTTLKYKFIYSKLTILINDDKDLNKSDIMDCVENMINKPPLSKFGIQTDLELIFSVEDFVEKIKNKYIYIYKINSFNKYSSFIEVNEINCVFDKGNLLSEIAININEQDF